MKIHYSLLLILFCIHSINTKSQTPQAISYQAIARDNAGNLIVNQNISLRFSIHDATAAGTIVYQETQSMTTNALGLFTANIGQGTVVSGSFATIDWGGGSKFIQVEMDAAGGASYVDMGTQQMLSVPYALNAANGNWTKTGNDITNSNSGNVGIGTLTPTTQMHTTGTVRLQGLDGSTGLKPVYVDSLGNLVKNTLTNNNTTPNLSIPDNNCTGITSTINISGVGSTISSSSVKVTININHTYDLDLDVLLQAPNGKIISLLRSNGGNGDNFTNTVFTDAGALLTTGTAPYREF